MFINCDVVEGYVGCVLAVCVCFQDFLLIICFFYLRYALSSTASFVCKMMSTVTLKHTKRIIRTI